MNNEIKVENWNGYDIRFVLHEGKWWAVLADICGVLDIQPNNAKRQLKSRVRIIHPIPDKFGRSQPANIITTKAITKLTFRSRKKESEEFQDWVSDVVEYLREQAGLEGYEYFMTWNKEFQKTCITRLHDGLPMPTRGDYCKANMIANKAVANLFEFDRAVKKEDMTPSMLKLRNEILPYIVDLIIAKGRFGLDISVRDNVYNKAYELFNNMEE